MEKNQNERKISLGVKIGYAMGGAYDSIPYTLMGTYFLYYLTDIAGIPAGIAGTISFVAVLSQVVTGPIVAYISDNSRNPKGRRRPLLIKIMIPFAIVAAFLFYPIGGTITFKSIYYLVFAVLFYLFYAAYTSVWSALGAELTQDYTERNNIRFWVGILGNPFILIVTSGCIGMVGIFSGRGVAVDRSWFFAVGVCAIIMFVCGMVSWVSTKGKEPVAVKEISEEKTGMAAMVREYISYMKLKIFKRLVLFTLFFIIGYIMMNNATVFVLDSVAHLSEAQQSLFWTLNTVVAMITLYIAIIVANKWDKKKASLLFVGLYGAASVVWFVLGITKGIGFTSIFIFSVCVAFGTAAFYSLSYSLVYDCCDVYDLVHGERKEGGMLALAYLAQTIAGALGALFLGWGLQLFGYTGSGAETESAVTGVLSMCTIVPAVFVAISMIFLARYNLTRKDFEKVTEALNDRKEGKAVDLEQFRHII